MMNKNQGTPCEIQVKVLLATQQKVLINHRKIIYLPPSWIFPFLLKEGVKINYKVTKRRPSTFPFSSDVSLVEST